MTERETTGDDECDVCLRLGVACGRHAPAPAESAADCLRCRDMMALLGVPCAVHHVPESAEDEPDDGRASRVEVRAAPASSGGIASEAAFLAMLRALQPLQSHAAGLRSVAYGQSGSGGVREVTADERAIDAGAVGRGRGAWARLAGVASEHRAALRWLVDRAHVGDLGTLARLYAEQHGPMALRDALDAAATARTKAAATYQREGPSPGCAMTVDGMRAREALTTATTREAAADAALSAWGVEALAAACEAWRGAGGEERAA